ncbi:MAG: hypothetical protein IPK94_05250 [Saprospiraceae bacterium]|nr:hypothetical protein [Saprospiraceae bacterium]
MKKLLVIVRKEFAQIFRQPAILRMMTAMPIVQLILIPLAADYEVRNINLQVIDFDYSTHSQEMIQKTGGFSVF